MVGIRAEDFERTNPGFVIENVSNEGELWYTILTVSKFSYQQRQLGSIATSLLIMSTSAGGISIDASCGSALTQNKASTTLLSGPG